MSIGSGMAVAAMWCAVGAVGWRNPMAGVAVGFLAFLAMSMMAAVSQ